MELLSDVVQTLAKFESPGCAAINDLALTKGDISPIKTPLSHFSSSILNCRRRRRQQAQFLPKPIDLGELKYPHSDTLPSLRHSDQGGKDQLQTALLVKEPRDHPCPPLLLLKGPLQQIRCPNRFAMHHRTAQMGQTRLQILTKGLHRR